MSHKGNDALNDILLDHIETITKLNPDQLKVYNELHAILFEGFLKKQNKKEEK